MIEIKLPIEVQIVMRDMKHLDTRDLLCHLQSVADEWYWNHVPTVPCSVTSKGTK